MSETAVKHRLHVISHTHWDREWYLSHENFRLLLVDLIDHLIDIMEGDAEFRFFQLDGQTIVLEDYLEIRPHQRDRLTGLIRSGRILIGPWYLQNDEYLTDGESTVRNLLIGHRMCREYAVPPMMIGYVPDQFGNIAQLPQILNGFNITSAVYGRGYTGPDNAAEFTWRGSDGSEVFAVFLMSWYNNAQRFPQDPEAAIRMCREIIEGQDGRAQTASRLLMNGVDHLESQENLSPILRDVNALSPGFELIHSTLPAYIDEVRSSLPECKSHQGELREGNEGFVLTGTASARVHLKQWNFKLQQELRRWVEPFAVLARLTGSTYDCRDVLDYAWKWLIQCHPHDSICGCSIDEVHFQMEARFSRVNDVLRDQLRRSMRHIAAAVDPQQTAFHSKLTLFNPHPFPVAGVIEADIDLLENEKLTAFEIVDSTGAPVDFQPLASRKYMIRVLNPKRLPKLLSVNRVRTTISADNVPGLGYKTLFLAKRTEGRGEALRKGKKPTRYRGQSIAEAGLLLNNEFLSAKINPNGTLDLHHKESGRTYRGIHYFEDIGDIGNEYIFMRPKNDSERTTEFIDAEAEVLENSSLRQRIRITCKWKLPRELDDKSQSRSGRPADYVITSVFTLAKTDRFLSVETSVSNNIKDHRLRVMIPTHIKQTHALADAPFDIVSRPFELNVEGRNNQQPMESFFTVNDGRNGMAVFSAGMPEYEVLKKDSTMALTLLRCVDVLADFPAEHWEREQMLDDFVPAAQCLRDYTFRYAIYPYSGNADSGRVKQTCDMFLHPIRLFQLPADDPSWLGVRPGAPPFFNYFEDDASKLPEPPKSRPFENTLLSVDNPLIALSAVKFPEDRKLQDAERVTGVARLINMSDTEQQFTVTSDFLITHAELWKMNEVRIEERSIGGNSMTLKARGKEVVTLALTFQK